MNTKILLTGFEPFLGARLNPSQMIVESLASRRPEISTFVLPTSYTRAAELIKHQVATGRFAKILMLGQAAGRSEICLERVALNWCESELADNDGVSKKIGPLIQNEEAALFSSCNLENLNSVLMKNKIEGKTSFSAGTFVCNSTYFYALKEKKDLNLSDLQILFVHVPLIPEQISSNEEWAGLPCVDLQTLIHAVELLIDHL